MWGLDLGTTNSVLARWHDGDGRPRLVAPMALRRSSEPGAPSVVPSAVELVDDAGFWDKLAARPFFLPRATFGRLGWIGGEALARNYATPRAAFAPGFKAALMGAPLRTLARAGGRDRSAREVARVFLRELLLAAEAEAGEQIESLVVTAPVEAYETFRAEVAGLLREVGVKRARFVDEPVAAALGYGVGGDRGGRVLVVDFGGGTFHAALVDLTSSLAGDGSCVVLAKAGRAVGGDTVDGWLRDMACERLGLDVGLAPEWLQPFWERLLLAEACRVKEALHTAERSTFRVPSASDLHYAGGCPTEFSLSRDELEQLLSARGVPAMLDGVLSEVLASVKVDEISDVVVVGGSTLLPGLYKQLEGYFGRARLRAWHPFEAIGYGAACFAAGKTRTSDFIVHDYALRTHDPVTHTAEYTVLVPRGTRFPTAPDFWRKSLVPTCALGEPESVFQLVVYELGPGVADGRQVQFDADGRARQLRRGVREPGAVPLNASSPVIGTLDPPHPPGDSRPRLDLQIGVDADRWLCVTAIDLWSGRALMANRPIVQLV